MAEPDKRQTGDGADSYAQAARQMANAARQMGRETARQAASAGTQAVSNASAMMVQASVEGGKAAAQVAAGSAAAGPLGAILSAAWSLRHTLYKILIFVCLVLLIFIVLVVSLPSLMLEPVLGMNGAQAGPSGLQDSYAALDDMVAHVEGIVNKLGLRYRILRLCGGDLSFTSAITYDFELWSAAQQRWLEISSVSNFETYQANRLHLRYRDDSGKTQLVHTLNGSSLALPRVVAALLEDNQTPDGIVIPEILRPYTGFDRID